MGIGALIGSIGSGGTPGDITAVVAGTNLTGGGTSGSVTVNAPTATATVAGAVPTPPNSTTQFLRGDATWSVPLPDPLSTVSYYTDFLEAPDTAVGGVWGPWFTQSNSAAGISITASAAAYAIAARPGVLYMDCGTTTTGRVGILGNKSTKLGGGVITWEASLSIPNLSTLAEGFCVQAGLQDTATSVNQTDGVYFEYDERNAAGHNAGNVNKWIAVVSTGGVRRSWVLDGTVVSDGGITTVNAPLPGGGAPGTFQRLGIVINAAGTQADFYVNGVLSARATSGLPASTGLGFNIIKSTGTTDQAILAIDWMNYRIALTTSRG